MKSIQYLSIHKRQDGAVLIFSIILLLVMTLLGLSSLNTSTLQERVAANSQDYSRTFQASESATAIEVTTLIAGNGTNNRLGIALNLNGQPTPAQTFAGMDPNVTTQTTVQSIGQVSPLLSGNSITPDGTSVPLNHYVMRTTSYIGNDPGFNGTDDNRVTTTISQGFIR